MERNSSFVERMAITSVYNFYGLAIFLCVTSVLTSSANNDMGQDSALKYIVNINLTHPTSNKSDQTVAATRPRTDSDTAKEASVRVDGNAQQSVALEGGVENVHYANVPPVQRNPKYSTATSTVSTNSLLKNYNESVLQDVDDSRTNVKPAIKIIARKGAQLPVENDTQIKKEDITVTPTIASDDKNLDEKRVKINTSTTAVNKQNATVTSKLSANETAGAMPALVPEKKTSTDASKIATKKHKPKPTVTIGEAELDKPIPASPTKSLPLGMPRKIDYIVPAVITIVALPLLAATAYIMYRRGRDCWDKRHYRRMDFLIDGMYND